MLSVGSTGRGPAFSTPESSASSPSSASPPSLPPIAPLRTAAASSSSPLPLSATPTSPTGRSLCTPCSPLPSPSPSSSSRGAAPAPPSARPLISGDGDEADETDADAASPAPAGGGAVTVQGAESAPSVEPTSLFELLPPRVPSAGATVAGCVTLLVVVNDGAAEGELAITGGDRAAAGNAPSRDCWLDRAAGASWVEAGVLSKEAAPRRAPTGRRASRAVVVADTEAAATAAAAAPVVAKSGAEPAVADPRMAARRDAGEAGTARRVVRGERARRDVSAAVAAGERPAVTEEDDARSAGAAGTAGAPSAGAGAVMSRRVMGRGSEPRDGEWTGDDEAGAGPAEAVEGTGGERLPGDVAPGERVARAEARASWVRWLREEATVWVRASWRKKETEGEGAQTTISAMPALWPCCMGFVLARSEQREGREGGRGRRKEECQK